MGKVIMHVDLNYFFVRCEELRNKSLENKPVMIGGLGRAGIVSTCSYEARKYGIRSGMPTYKALNLCPKLIRIDGDHKYYSLISKEFFFYCKSYTHQVEAASIDECYMDITSIIKEEKDVLAFLKRFQDGLYNKLGLKCSIGVASTRFLAKMASDYKKPMGITIIRKKDIPTMLYPLDISSFFGIGKKSTPKLKAIGINTIGDLANFINNNKNEAKKYFQKFYYDIKKDLDGTSSDDLYLEQDNPKSIGNSTTLIHDTDEEEEISKTIYLLSKQVSERAKKEKVVGKSIQLTLKNSEFKVFNKTKTLEEYTNEVDDIYKIAYKLYINNYKDEVLRLVGVTLNNLTSSRIENVQMTFFNYQEYEKKDRINIIVGNINRKFNRKVVDKASNLLREKKHGNL